MDGHGQFRARRSMRRARAPLLAAILAAGAPLVGWPPQGEPASVLADGCREGAGTIAIVGSIGDTVIVRVQQGKRAWLGRSDGTSTDVRPITGNAFRSLPAWPGVTVGDALYFVADDRAGHPFALWRTDGTPEGTAIVKDIRAGPEGSGSPALAVVGPMLYFFAAGAELWRSDGTPEGTALVKDIAPGRAGVPSAESPWFESGATILDEALLFAAGDGGQGVGLWRSDGTPEGTTLLRSFATAPDGATASPGPGEPRARPEPRPRPGRARPSDLAPLVVVGKTLYFSFGSLRVGGELWRSDGTPEGTSRLSDATGALVGAPLATVAGSAVVGGTLYVVPSDPTVGVGPELWRSDGTPEGTSLVRRFEPGPEGWGPSDLSAVGETLYFSADDGEHGRELWRSDGTPEGTTMVKDIRPGPEWSRPGSLTAVGETPYFAADDGEHGAELWRSDGTPEGTTLVSDTVPGPRGWGPEIKAVIGQTLFFTFLDGERLWRSDGTAEGTVLVKDQTRTAGVDPDLTVVGGSVYFGVSSCARPLRELWRTDEATNETVRLLRLR